jgi:hypothetical protein
MRLVSLLMLSAALVAGAPAQRCQAASKNGGASLTAEQIVAKNVAARGGLEAWRRTDTMIWVGQLQSARASVPNMPFVLQQKRPNKSRFEINGGGQRTMRVFDGEHGWKVQAKREGGPDVKPYTPPELKFASAAQAIDGPLMDYRAKGSTVALQGVETIEGRKTYHLNVTLVSGERQDVWVDAKNFLDVRVDRPSYGASGTEGTVPVYYRNYKLFEGLQIPTTIEIGTGKTTDPDRMQIERVVINPTLDDRTFERPGAQHRRNPSVMNTLPSRAPNRVIPGLPANSTAPSAASPTPPAGASPAPEAAAQ